MAATYCPDVWSCYIIANGRCSYVGVSPRPERRLRQHNCELTGGAKYTRSKGPDWSFVCIVSGFDKISSLQFEWAVKHCAPTHTHGPKARVDKLFQVLNRQKWTKNSQDASNIPLIIQWYDHSLRRPELSSPSYVREVFVEPLTERHDLGCDF